MSRLVLQEVGKSSLQNFGFLASANPRYVLINHPVFFITDIHLASPCPRWPTTQRWSLPPPSNPYPSSVIPHLTTTSIHRPLHPRKNLPPSTPPPTPSPLRTQSRQMSFVNARAASLSHRFLTSVSNSPISPASSLRRPGGRWRTSPCEIRSYFLLRRPFYGTWQCTDGGSGI